MVSFEKNNLFKKYNIPLDLLYPDTEEYEMNAVLKPKNTILVEARRIIINEDLDEVQDRTLKGISDKNNSKYEICSKLQSQIKWEDEQFWKNLQHPTETVKNVKSAFKTQTFAPLPLSDKDIDLLKIQRLHKDDNVSKTTNDEKCLKDTSPNYKHILKKYFSVWRKILLDRKEKIKRINQYNEKKNKLDAFIQHLEEKKSQKIVKTEVEEKSRKECDVIEIKAQTKEKKTSPRGFEVSSYNHRFKAQQEIIEAQRVKLEQQAKIIEAMKLGKLEEELKLSLDTAKINIREIFSKCSTKIKCKMAPILDENHRATVKFNIDTGKAPKIVKEMEKRAFERALRRELILERKRLMDEERKRLVELEIANKKAQDEEEKKKNLEAIKERRRRDLELQQLRQKNKERYLRNLSIAEDFYKKQLLLRGLKGFKQLVRMRKLNELKSTQFYNHTIVRKCWKKWKEFVEQKNIERYAKMRQFYISKLLRKTFDQWYKVYWLRIRNMQAAEDFYDFQLLRRCFNYWVNYYSKEYVRSSRNKKKAENHYNRHLVVHYFYLWKTLPAVLKLERVREEKKRKWREKVWEILPDYSYPEEID